MRVFSVERDYGEYEPCNLERVFGTREAAETYARREKDTGTSADMIVVEWDTETGEPPGSAQAPSLAADSGEKK